MGKNIESTTPGALVIATWLIAYHHAGTSFDDYLALSWLERALLLEQCADQIDEARQCLKR